MGQKQGSLDVLMATYNGAAFLDQQIRSVLRQSWSSPFRLIVRDDGSTDATPDVLRRYATECSDIVQCVADNDHLGSCGNFSRLMEQSSADYVMPCDQDDVWMLDKIAVTWAEMNRLESIYGRDVPILVHTDLQVADSELKPVSSSFAKYEGLDPIGGGRLRRLLLQNVVTGCTLMANRALLQKAKPIPPEAIMHDWWLGLVAAAFGKLAYLPRATMLYRQHSENRVGAHELDAGYAIRKGLNFLGSDDIARQLLDTQRQAQAFLDRFGGQLSRQQRDTLDAYATLHHRSFLRRRAILLQYGFYKHGWLRNLGLLASI